MHTVSIDDVVYENVQSNVSHYWISVFEWMSTGMPYWEYDIQLSMYLVRILFSSSVLDLNHQ
jgi:hypothetical protein